MKKTKSIYWGRILYFENSNQAIEWNLFWYKIKRREPVQGNRDLLKDVSFINYRRSKAKGYKYITITIFHYFTINLELHKPL